MALIIALFLASLLVMTAMVLDFGLVRVDRQVNKSAADAAAAAGLQSMAGASKPYPYKGICSAINYLQKNSARFSGVTHDSGTWTNGNGLGTADGCTDATLLGQVCIATNKATWGRFIWNGTYEGEPIRVTIQSGYVLTGSGWSEEGLTSVANDQNDNNGGCNQLAVIVTQNRQPGLGSIATSSDLATSIRSVGRVYLGGGKDAPAMILLRRTGCPVLETGSNSGGSFIHVYGAVSSTGATAAGSIHADTDGSACSGGSNQNIFLGRANNGIVAYAAPLASNPSAPDPAKPGQLTSVAGDAGITGSVIRDNLAWAYSATGLNEGAPGTRAEPTGRALVTREPVDSRYLGLDPTTPFGVKAAVSTANSIFSSLTSKSAAISAGYKIIDSCDATTAEIGAISTTDDVYVNCTANGGYNGIKPIPGRRVVFAGSVKPPNTAGSYVSLPNATKVYIFGDPTKDAIAIGNNGGLKIHTTSEDDGSTNLDSSSPPQCSTSVKPNDKAVLVVKAGDIKQTGGLLQLCRTTVVMMGGQSDACLPTSVGTAPTTGPCSSGTGDGQLSLTGGASIDWTAPNTLDATTDASGNPTAAALTAWHDSNGPEDLALWSESAGLTSNPTYSMGGSGKLHTVGVFMVPNAGPFKISGGSAQTLVNAQYIATSIALDGTNTSITMRVDPNAAVTVPATHPIGLVR